MDNPTRWNISNSAQNIVSALVDPNKHFDSVFRREWGNTFAGFVRHKPSTRSKQDAELRTKLSDYIGKLENRKHIKAFETQQTEALQVQEQSVDGNHQIRTIVPDVFLLEKFNLSNLEIFNRVILSGDQSEAIYDSDTRKIENLMPKLFTKSRLKGLQSSFTDYLDIIEEKLASQISNRSGDFFQVMSSVDCVMDELSLAIKSVTNLRKKCSKLNDSLILPNMRSIHLSKARSNAQTLLDRMNEIAYLSRVQPMIQLLLSDSDFVGALDLIAKSRVMLHKDLTRVVSLRHLECELVEIERMIATMMQQEFLTLISSEWSWPTSDQQTSAANRLSKLFEYFANGFSELPERSNSTLLSLLHIQAEKFVNQFHEERKKRIESTLDVEQWKVVEEVPVDFQRLICMLVDENISISDTFSVENYQSNGSNSRLGHSREPSDSGSVLESGRLTPRHNGSTTITSPTKTKYNNDINSPQHQQQSTLVASCGKGLSYVTANGSTYVIVNSVINLIRTVMDYCKCAHDIRSLSAELLERLFKILQLFNTKTYHLVYSAGAIQVAGLKTITTRSLAVSQRSLKLVILLIPAIHKHFSQLLPNDKRLRRFDEIKSSYEEHAAKIPERVNSIVKDVINLQLQEWEARPPVPSAQFSAVTQHLMRLHENIQDALPADELRLLFMKISHTFKEVLIMHLRRLNISNDAGPQQWLVMQELTFYKISLSKLAAFSGWELNYDDLWTKLNLSSSTDPSSSLSSLARPFEAASSGDRSKQAIALPMTTATTNVATTTTTSKPQ